MTGIAFRLSSLLTLLWTASFLLFRPSILGERYNAVVLVIFLLVTSDIIFVNQKQRVRINTITFSTYFLIIISVLYFFVQGLILSDATRTVVNSGIFLLLVVTSIMLVVSVHQKKVIEIFIWCHYLMSISAIITFTLYILGGFSLQHLSVASPYDLVRYADLDPGRPFSNHLLIFPFSIIWSATSIFGLEVPRFVGIYREPGMAQIFFCTAFAFSLFANVKNKRLKQVTILIGTFLTFSAAGFINVILVILLYLIMNGSFKEYVLRLFRNPFLVILIFIILIVVVYQSNLMVQERLSQVSGMGRVESFKRGAELLLENPVFGEGYYNSFKKDKEGIIISDNFIGILGVSYQIGLIGLFLYFAPWIFRVLTTRKLFYCIYVPCLMTLLFSQPSYNDAFVYLLLLINPNNLVYE